MGKAALKEISRFPLLILNLSFPKVVMSWATTDELLSIFVPSVVYWIYSGIYLILESFENYKLHSKKEEEEKNLVSRMSVVKGVLFHQFTTIVVMLLSLKVSGGNDGGGQPSSFIDIVRQVIVAFLVLDTWSYFTHRYYHQNKTLYKYVHSQHHRLVVTYSFGGLYMHPVEGMSENIGSSLALLISGMSPQTSMFFFSFALIKLVDDHCGMKLPGNPFFLLFQNNAAYHDIHHQLFGTKYNFSVYFTLWDRLLGTYMPYLLEKKPEGGFQVRQVLKSAKMTD